MTISLSARQLTRIFASIVVTLVLIHVGLQVVRFSIDDHRLMGALAFFSVGADNNLPTFYSAAAILCCSGLLAAIAVAETQRGHRHRACWFGLSLIFAFLSIDEMLSIHERLEEPMSRVFGEWSFLYYAWVVPYAVATLGVAAFYVPFLLRLPRLTAVRFVIAGSLYVGGAIGFEMIGGAIAAEIGTQTIPYAIAQTIEETLEMVGIVLFLRALASYAQQQFGHIELRLAQEGERNPVPSKTELSPELGGHEQPNRSVRISDHAIYVRHASKPTPRAI